MSNIKLGESTLNNVESLKATDASDSTKYHIFYNEQKAILIVTAPAGSTIDILQNSIVLQTYTLSASETTHEFRVSVSATQYTVRATLDTKTASKNVLVEQASVYNIKLAYLVYLYNAGDECSTVSGGWTLTNNNASSSKTSSYVQLKLDGRQGNTSLECVNSINPIGHFTIGFTISEISSMSTFPASQMNFNFPGGVNGYMDYGKYQAKDFIYNIINTNSRTVKFYFYNWTTGYSPYIKITKVWLE